ncbi:MAG TPA: hypothetical protein PK971_16900 [Saprospiraceae bacterium]|nr:hypothetical protein [Saprospiraceae bacterium]HND90015.1 hypothetical protein [Saprospiraceae bacterium]
MSPSAPTFADFVAKFPPVSVPLTLGEDTHHTFGTENAPLTQAMISRFILPLEGGSEDDEFTEYLPCFSLEDTQNFVALVWWKAALLDYAYTLATFTPQGQLIGKQEIAHTRSVGDKISHAVVVINEDWELTIAEGSSIDGNLAFDPNTSRTRYLEILSDGQIV